MAGLVSRSMRFPGAAGAPADERLSPQMIVPLMKRSEPGDGTRPARQTASFTTDAGPTALLSGNFGALAAQ